MKTQWIILVAFLVSFVWSQKVEPDNDGFMAGSYGEFMDGKSSQGHLWYTGVGFTTFGSLSLIIASHYDGLAAIDRNEAAVLFQSGESGDAYMSAYSRTKDLEDKRNVYWKVGLAMGMVGAGIIAYELFIKEDVIVQAKLDGVQVKVGF